MRITHNDNEIKENRIVLPLPGVSDRGEVIVPEILGRKKDSHVSDLTKELIAIDSVTTDLPQHEIAKIHNTSQSLVNFTSRGFDRTNLETRKVDEDVRKVISETREKVAKSASDKLLQSLDLFNPSALDQKELPGAALKISTVLEKASQGFEGSSQENAVTFVVMAPRMRAEESYEVISADED